MKTKQHCYSIKPQHKIYFEKLQNPSIFLKQYLTEKSTSAKINQAVRIVTDDFPALLLQFEKIEILSKQLLHEVEKFKTLQDKIFLRNN